MILKKNIRKPLLKGVIETRYEITRTRELELDWPTENLELNHTDFFPIFDNVLQLSFIERYSFCKSN